VAGGNCVFLAGIEQMYIPIAHGEGRFVTRDEPALRELKGRGRLVLRYAPLGNGNGRQSADSVEAGPIDSVKAFDFDQPLDYQANPNGSELNVAGICDSTGRIFGLMPHPERYIDPTQHPRWTRGEAGEVGDGLRLFQNAVRFFH
jgi:phosphoribosylformylglycinamidine synthase